MTKCKICENSINNKIYHINEMMYGTGKAFSYFQCEKCKCLQISKIPCNMDEFYLDDEYYSLQIPKPIYSTGYGGFLRKKRDQNILYNKNSFLGKIGKIVYPQNEFNKYTMLKNLPKLKVLDVGCGNGEYIYDLYSVGIREITGVDLYYSEVIKMPEDIKIVRGTIFDIEEKYNVIMFNHSFEHMDSPEKVLRKAKEILLPDGYIIIRIPMVNYAWEQYLENWVQIDAPRHFYLHSKESIKCLLDNVELEIHETIYDSTEFQFIASELYRHNIPLINQSKKEIKKHFSKEKLKNFQKQANDLNKEKKGDQAIIFIKKANEV